MEPFSYPNSQHTPSAAPAATPAPAAPAPAPAPAAPAAEQPAGEPKPFSFKTDQPLPQGRSADQLPPDIRKEREEDPNRKMFSPQVTYRDAIAAKDDWPAENKALAAEFREIAADMELPEPVVRELAAISNGLTELPSAETKASWEAEAWNALRGQYGGEQGARDALAAAQRYIARDPLLVEYLKGTGLGSHPKFVQAAVQAARSRGR
jgi:hypothetical protein